MTATAVPLPGMEPEFVRWKGRVYRVKGTWPDGSISLWGPIDDPHARYRAAKPDDVRPAKEPATRPSKTARTLS
jgi:hypothetical protein